MAVGSIVAQGFQDWELVVVGQGDRGDDLQAAVNQAAAGDARVRYIHSARRGLCLARNLGIGLTTGEIVAFMDDDCEAAPDWLYELDKAFEPTVDLVSGAVTLGPKASRRIAVCPSISPRLQTFDLPVNSLIPDSFVVLGANMAFRRRLLERVGGFDEYMGAGAIFQGGEEHDYIGRVVTAGAVLRCTPAPSVQHTYGYRYGLRSVYSYKRQRIRGDAAVMAKRAMLADPSGGVSIRTIVLSYAKKQARTVRPWRLPIASARIGILLIGFRSCLRDFVLAIDSSKGNPSAVLHKRAQSEARDRTGAAVITRADAS